MHPYLIFSYFTVNVHDNEEDILVISWVVKNRHRGEGIKACITSTSVSVSSGLGGFTMASPKTAHLSVREVQFHVETVQN